MFPFTFWKKREPVGPLAVEDAVFTREDLFVLLGGFDSASFVIHEDYMDLNYQERNGNGPWRERLVARFGPRGLVDSAGRPCPELEETLAPMVPPSFFVSNGDEPRELGERERRIAAVYVDAARERCTIAVPSGRGFRIAPMGPDRAEWERRFLRAFGLEGRWRQAREAQHYIEGGYHLDDTELSDAVTGGVSTTRAYCEKRRISSPMLEAVAALPWYNRPSLAEFLAVDMTKGVYSHDLGYFVPGFVGGTERTKGDALLPEVGLSVFWGVAPRDGIPMYENGSSENVEKCRYTGFDFIGPETGLLDYLLTFYDYPE